MVINRVSETKLLCLPLCIQVHAGKLFKKCLKVSIRFNLRIRLIVLRFLFVQSLTVYLELNYFDCICAYKSTLASCLKSV